MSLELIANEDAEVSFENTAGPPDLTYSTDQPVDTSPAAVSGAMATASGKVSAEGKPVLTTSINIVWTPDGCPYSSATHTFAAGGGVIIPSATKVKAEGVLVMREGDGPATPPGVGCIGSWTLPGSPPVTVPCACDIEISVAGQTKVKAQ